ncbi:MAG TPA: hypothetical protein PK782_17930, partial [Nitrospira sp.]|nr:hypothetical protein [Nitrospira sp.]
GIQRIDDRRDFHEIRACSGDEIDACHGMVSCTAAEVDGRSVHYITNLDRSVNKNDSKTSDAKRWEACHGANGEG